MIRLLIVFLFLSFGLFADEPRRPLDLPSGGRGANDDEEDQAEIIEYYGGEYEGDAFMFVIDVSGSMAGSNRLDDAKQEVLQAINSLSSSAEFGVLAFDHTLIPLSNRMFRASAANKANAAAWIATLVPEGATCIDLGVVAGLQILYTSNKPAASQKLILLGDGGQYCMGFYGPEIDEQVLADIALANWKQVSIDTILLTPLNPIAAEPALILFAEIAAQNDGTFRAL